MTAARQDAWTPDDDLILAEVTLRHIREGSTQLAAFEEVGEKIGRTAAACGFRWNSCVRKQYEEAIKLAKEQKKKLQAKKYLVSRSQKEQPAVQEGEADESRESRAPLSIDAVIRFMRQWKNTHQELVKQLRGAQKRLKELEEENRKLRSDNEDLRQRVNATEHDYRTVNEDYKALIQIMDRARKLSFLNDDLPEEAKVKFRMDANGNLERVE